MSYQQRPMGDGELEPITDSEEQRAAIEAMRDRVEKLARQAYALKAAKPPAAVQAGDVRESQRCRAVTAISDQLFHPSDHNHKDAVKALRVLSLMTKSPAQPPALTALVEAAREYMDMRVHDDYCFAVTMENTQGECLCGYAELAAALTPFLDSAQPKQEAPDDAR